MLGAGSRRCRDGGGSGMAEVPGWRGRDHGGAGMMEAGWRRCRDGEGRITEVPGSQSHPRRYRHPPSRSPGSAPGTGGLQPAPTPRGARPGRTPAAAPRHGASLAAAPLPVQSCPPRLRSGCSVRARPGCGGTGGRSHGRVPGAGPAITAAPCPSLRRGGPVGTVSLATPPCTARHRPRFPGSVPRGSGTSGRPVVLPCAAPGLGVRAPAGAAVPVPRTVSVPQEPGSAVPGVPEARRRAVAMLGVSGAPVPRVPEA